MAQIILASGSRIRADLLRQAGIEFDIVKSDVDESVIKQKARERGDPIRDIAMSLAAAKAKKVSQQHPGAMVIGADQILGFDNEMFDKPESMEDAAKRLLILSGKAHVLYNAACIFRDGEVRWQTITYPRLTMRTLSEQEIYRYLAAAGPNVLSSVGAYQLEGLGARLFHEIEGDYFSILGLPLLQVTGFLEEQGLLEF